MDVANRFRQDLVIDGGLASLLERLGADLTDELWSARLLLDDPDTICRAHRAYFEAGADVAIGASYQASFEGFARRGIDHRGSVALLRRSVELAREAAEGLAEEGRTPLVAASVGPYGAVLADGSEYDGRYGMTTEELVAFHEPRLDVLLGAEPDLLAVETIPSIVETEAIVRLLDARPEARAWMTFSCRDEERISDGTPIADAATLAASSEAVLGVGVNCTPPGFVAGLLRRIRRRLPDTPLVAYPNLGSTWDAGARSWRAEGPRPDFGAGAAAWYDEGAKAVGGCCGTVPDDVAAIAAVLRRRGVTA
ncbi:MAG TPA: homocysteine S-methyltransferase [Actinomycetota bacterium]|nr:homocysteine S-methyltransferase [Actinomycetota bacterium]